MAEAVYRRYHKLLDWPEGLGQVLGGASQDIDVIPQLSPELDPDVDPIDVYQDEVLLQTVGCSMLVLQGHDSVVEMNLSLK